MATISKVKSHAHRNHWTEIDHMVGIVRYLLPNGGTVQVNYNSITKDLTKIIDVNNCSIEIHKIGIGQGDTDETLGDD